MQIWWITVSAKGRLCFWQRIIDHILCKNFAHNKMEILTTSEVDILTFIHKHIYLNRNIGLLMEMISKVQIMMLL